MQIYWKLLNEPYLYVFFLVLIVYFCENKKLLCRCNMLLY